MISDQDRDAIKAAGDAQQREIESWRGLDSTERDLIRRVFTETTDEGSAPRSA